MRLILLFVLVPFLELIILLKIAAWTSGWWTVALVVFTGIVGAALARRQGWGVIRQLQAEVEAGQLPTTTLIDALMIFVAGALLITPGVLTDLFGFSLLIPACRRVYRAALLKLFKSWHEQVVVTTRSTAGGSFADAEPSAGRDVIIDSYVIARPRDEAAEGSSS